MVPISLKAFFLVWFSLIILGINGCGKPPAPVETPATPPPAPAAEPEPLPILESPILLRKVFEASGTSGPDGTSEMPWLISLRLAGDEAAAAADEELLKSLQPFSPKVLHRLFLVLNDAEEQGIWGRDPILQRSLSASDIQLRASPSRLLLDGEANVRGWYPGHEPSEVILNDLQRALPGNLPP